MGSLFKNPRGSLAEKHPSTLKQKGWKDTLSRTSNRACLCARRSAAGPRRWHGCRPWSHRTTGSWRPGWVWRRGVPCLSVWLCVNVICICQGHLSWVAGRRNGHPLWMDGEEDIRRTWRDADPSWRDGYPKELIPKAPLTSHHLPSTLLHRPNFYWS